MIEDLLTGPDADKVYEVLAWVFITLMFAFSFLVALVYTIICAIIWVILMTPVSGACYTTTSETVCSVSLFDISADETVEFVVGKDAWDDRKQGDDKNI